MSTSRPLLATGPPARRLVLCDRLAPFRHVLEHPFEREQKGLFVEAPRGA